MRAASCARFSPDQLDVLDLHLLQGFTQIGGGLIDVLLHLFVIGGERHRHRVDAVLQHVQLAEHVALHAAVELAAADAVDGVHHVADRAGHVAHQAVSEQDGDAHAQQQQQGGDEHLFILLQPHRLQIQLDRHIAQVVVGVAAAVGGFIRILAFRQDRRAQDQRIAASGEHQLGGQRHAFRQL